jgi:tyrosinase
MHLHSTAQAQFALDRVKVSIPSKAENGRIYLTWRPIKAQASYKSSNGKPNVVTLRNAGNPGGGTLVFGGTRDKAKGATMSLTLPANGDPVDFWIGGETASSEDLDAVLEVARSDGKAVLATVPMMVRIRKDAVTLNSSERGRFLRALAKMNNNSTSPYMTMRGIHIGGMSGEAHHNPAFLPWHRAYLLDFERELQAVDPSVALPYWRFDEMAPSLFTKDFLGAPPSGSKLFAVFDTGNPLYTWVTNDVAEIERRPDGWDPLMEAAPVAKQNTTVGEKVGTTVTGPPSFDAFRKMELNPHDRAHISWIGVLRSPSTAPRDPLFFMLHAYVDRLWALWQSFSRATRIDPLHDDAFSSIRHTVYNRPEIAPRIGHHLNDTMWPWNEDTTPPRPNFSTGGPMRASTITPQVPPDAPRISDMIDYQGVETGAYLGFDYDDVKFPKDP